VAATAETANLVEFARRAVAEPAHLARGDRPVRAARCAARPDAGARPAARGPDPSHAGAAAARAPPGGLGLRAALHPGADRAAGRTAGGRRLLARVLDDGSHPRPGVRGHAVPRALPRGGRTDRRQPVRDRRGDARCPPAHGADPGHAAVAATGARHRHGTGVRPLPRRVRCHVDLRRLSAGRDADIAARDLPAARDRSGRGPGAVGAAARPRRGHRAAHLPAPIMTTADSPTADEAPPGSTTTGDDAAPLRTPPADGAPAARVRASVAGRAVDVDIAVPAGQVVALLGANGAGKSTVLGLAAGTVRPTAGTVEIGGRTVAGPRWVPPHGRHVALLAQDPLLFPHLDVTANVAFGLRATGLRRGEAARRAREMLEIVGAAHLVDRRPGELSGGQAQRVALARALAPDP